MVDIPEYKYGRNSLIVSVLAFILISFPSYFNYLRIPIINLEMFGTVISIAWISLIGAIAYFTYGYRRTHDKAKIWEYKLANYLTPNKERIEWSLKILFIVYALVFVIYMSHYGFNFIWRNGFFRYILNTIPTRSLFNEYFLIWFNLAYLLQPFLIKSKKIVISILVIVLILFSIEPIKNFYNSITAPKFIGDNNERAKSEIINRLRVSTDLVSLSSSEITLGKHQSNQLFWGIRNNLTKEEDFKIDLSCDNSQENIELQTFKKRIVQQNETQILLLMVATNKKTEIGRYECMIDVSTSDGISYATKDFVIVVK